MPQIALRDLSMHYEQEGEGPDLVWVSGGGSQGKDWNPYQVEAFRADYRNTTFDNRGIGKTRGSQFPEWSIGNMADDVAALIEAVCEPPVYCVGLSMGSLITQELAIQRPDLVRACVVMGTLAKATGWVYDYMQAEIDWRRQGNGMDGMMAATHYAVYGYPASALSDPATMKAIMGYLHQEEWVKGNEESLIPQWEACNRYDVTESLPGCHVPMHVIGFEQDVQAPPAWGMEVARLAPHGDFTLVADAGHYSCWGHKHEEINAHIRSLLVKH